MYDAAAARFMAVPLDRCMCCCSVIRVVRVVGGCQVMFLGLLILNLGAQYERDINAPALSIEPRMRINRHATASSLRAGDRCILHEGI